MNKEIIKQWDENKHKLEEFFRTDSELDDCSYHYIVKKVFEIAVPNGVGFDDEETWDTDRIAEIDFGDYQGDLIYIIPLSTYQPSPTECLLTTVSYGSCSGCDTLQAIQSEGGEEYPTEEQLEQYMMLALHLVQSAKMLYED